VRFEIIFGKTKKTRLIVILSIILGLLVFLFNYLYFSKNSAIFTTLNLISAGIILGPSIVMRYKEHVYMKEVESRFPDFLRDVTESISAGMTLPQAMKNAARNNYGALTPFTKHMAVQIDWGVPFETILEDFGRRTGSPVMKRTVSTIIETHRGGGNIAHVLKAVARSIVEVDKIKKERAARIYAQMITGYTIFFVFLGVMIGLQRFLIPSLGWVGSSESGVVSVPIGWDYENMFRWLIIIQGFFSGLAIGKMAEGSVIEGIKHSFVLVVIGYSAFVLLA